jgi:hypothetical protein
VNDRIRDLNRGLGDFTGPYLLVCECSQFECTEHIEVPAADYEATRGEGGRFLVKPGHEHVAAENDVRPAGNGRSLAVSPAFRPET